MELVSMLLELVLLVLDLCESPVHASLRLESGGKLHLMLIVVPRSCSGFPSVGKSSLMS